MAKTLSRFIQLDEGRDYGQYNGSTGLFHVKWLGITFKKETAGQFISRPMPESNHIIKPVIYKSSAIKSKRLI